MAKNALSFFGRKMARASSRHDRLAFRRGSGVIHRPSTMPLFCDKTREVWFSGIPANLAASSVTRVKTPPGGGTICQRRFIPMPSPWNGSETFCSGESGPSSRQSCSCRNSFRNLATGWWMKSFGGLAFTRPSGQRQPIFRQTKGPLGTNPIRDRRPSDGRDARRRSTFRLVVSRALERRGKLSSIRQISRTRDRGRANHLLVPFFAAPDQKIIYFLRFRVPLRHLS